MTISPRIFALSVFVLLTSIFVPTTHAQIRNPSFEGSGTVANGWLPWHYQLNITSSCADTVSYHEPAWSLARTSDLVRDGAAMQRIGSRTELFSAGIMQIDIPAEPNARYRFTVWARGHAADLPHPGGSDAAVPFAITAGINPNGGNQTGSGAVTFGAPINPNGRWQQASVEAVASRSGKISLVIAAQVGDGPNQCRNFVDVWLDEAALVNLSPPTARPTNTRHPVTNTPRPTNTRVFPTRTPVPTGKWPTLTPWWETNTPPPPTPVVVTRPPATATPRVVDEVDETATVEPTVSITITITIPITDEAVVTPTPTITVDLITETATVTPTVVTTEAVVVSDVVDVEPTASNTITTTTTIEPTTTPVRLSTLTPTPEPTATLEPTATPEGSAVICINTFSDTNGNGTRQEDEGYMGGISIQVDRGDRRIGELDTTGTAETVCFDGLAADTYTIRELLPSILRPTTAETIQLDVGDGQSIAIEFGSQPRADREAEIEIETAAPTDIETETEIAIDSETPTPQPPPSTNMSNNSLPILIAGIIVATLAIACTMLLVSRWA